ncbi:MAG: prepilin-type cleavage/methylation domain-containing protein [Betaproteobacteria bacterium HGW-Betaproteobacteria-11]|nr:MAG: prepilin-type cleavage/methylation domain-containing protein [Betaproteobacteria bacterium HGW-Betaproteobacteria-11]
MSHHSCPKQLMPLDHPPEEARSCAPVKLDSFHPLLQLQRNFVMQIRKSGGFSLVELLVVIAIIGIISAIAFPSYQEYLRKGNRSAAQQFMMSMANKQEAYLIDNRAYTATVGSGGLGLTAPSELSGKYTFALCIDPAVLTCAPAGTAAPYFKITATAAGSQLSDGDLTLTNAGAKTRSGASGW